MTHIERSHAFSLPMKAEIAFPLFTPKGELDWVDGWDPDFIYPQDGATCEGMVFRTTYGGEAAYWTCSRWTPDKRVAAYINVTPTSRVEIIEVQCHPTGHESAMVFVTYRITALTDQGERDLEAMTENTYRDMIDAWRGSIMARYGLA